MKKCLSPARITLAAAIAEVAEEEACAATLTKAIKRASRMIEEAETALYAARTAVARAQAEQTTAMIAAASNGIDYKDDGAVSAARLAEIVAADAVENARAALEALQAREPERFYGRGPVERARARAMAAAREVVRSEIDVGRLMDEVRPIQAELMARRGELVTLMTSKLVPDADQPALVDFLKSSVLPAVAGSSTCWPLAEHMASINPVLEAWDITLATLATDASAPLPDRRSI